MSGRKVLFNGGGLIKLGMEASHIQRCTFPLGDNDGRHRLPARGWLVSAQASGHVKRSTPRGDESITGHRDGEDGLPAASSQRPRR